MKKYKFIFDKSGKKFICPQCSQKRLVRYVEIETNEYLPIEFGICDRRINCAYNLNPYKEGYYWQNMKKNGNEWKKIKQYNTSQNVPKCQKLQTIPNEVIIHSMKQYETNNFIQYLLTFFDKELILKQIEAYFIGTVKNYTSFPFIDLNGYCRAISLIEYNFQGKRNKSNKQARNIHTFLINNYKDLKQKPPEWLNNYLRNETKFSCLFGEHLINQSSNKNKPIAIVEAPKTAFICSLIYINFVWVSAGALSYLTEVRLKPFLGREVYFFPDTSIDSKAFKLWNTKANQLDFTCIDILEKVSTIEQKKQGYDIADFILETPNIINEIIENKS